MSTRTLLCAMACVFTAAAQSVSPSYVAAGLRPHGATAGSPHLVQFDYPGATQTYVSAINNDGTVIGFYADAAGGHGYLRLKGGGMQSFDAPGSPDIYPDSINTGGVIAGNYGDTRQDGFVRTPGGLFTTFTVPGTFPSSSGNPIVINASGVIAGPYFDTVTAHGFVRFPNGAVDIIDYPGSTYTYVTGMNLAGTVTGIYNDANFVSHGFVAGSGRWFSFDVPGNNFGFFPPVLSINDSGEVAGTYFQGANHGFLWRAGGTLRTFDVSGAAGTQSAGINASGVVAGSYQDSSYNYHGFVRTVSGAVYTFSVFNAMWTYVVGINDNGTVAGYYLDSNYGSHGFLLVP